MKGRKALALSGLLVVARVFPLTYFAALLRTVMVEGAGLTATGGESSRHRRPGPASRG
jgi:hypothetical protein